MDVSAWLLGRCVMQELDSLHYTAQKMQELDSIHCDPTTTTRKVVVRYRHMSRSVTISVPLLSPTTTALCLLLLSLLDLELRKRAPPLFSGFWAGLSSLDGEYIPRGDP